MSSLVWLLIVWGVLTTILIVLLIYRSTLTMREDDQLFLDDSESHMQQEQMEVMRKVNKLNPLVRGFGESSLVLILVIAGLWIYRGLTMVPYVAGCAESTAGDEWGAVFPFWETCALFPLRLAWARSVCAASPTVQSS